MLYKARVKIWPPDRTAAAAAPVRSHCEASAASLASDSVPARLPVQLADMLRATGRLQALHSQLSQSRAGTGTNTAASSSRPSTASASDGSAKKVRLALIGCGSICHAHLNGLNALAAEHIQVTACIDPSERADEMAALVGQTAAGGGDTPRTFASLTEALAAGAELFDAVDIMLPHNLHRPVALEAMQGGKHVLLEKPMAPTLEDAQAILDAAAAMPLEHVFMMAENSQCVQSPALRSCASPPCDHNHQQRWLIDCDLVAPRAGTGLRCWPRRS